MKKLISLLLCLALCAGMAFTTIGCTGIEDDTASSTDTADTGSSSGSGEEVHDYRVTGVSLPESAVKYTANSGEKADKSNEFFVKGLPYLVGTDNAFIFKPDVSFIDLENDDMTESVTPAEWSYNYTLEINEAGVFTAADEEYLDSADTTACAFDFAKAAEGKTFRLSVTPSGLTAAQEANIGDYTATFTFNVVTGYNAYTAADLAYIANSPAAITGDRNAKPNSRNEYTGTNCTQAGWKAFRDAHGLTLDPTQIEAIIFHADITVTADDITQDMLFTAEEVAGRQWAQYFEGSLKDHADEGIYHRMINPGESFVIEGNYFTFDASAIPVTYDFDGTGKNIVFNEDGTVKESGTISHAQVFYFESPDMNQGLHATGLSKNELNDTDSFAAIRNLSILGNSPRTEDAAAQGGLIFEKDERVYMEMSNLISRKMFITLFSVGGDGTLDCTDIKVYDSYNSPVFCWANDDTRLTRCYFTNSGGPAIIGTMYHFGSSYGGRIICPRVVAVDCVFDNAVSGDEAWFTTVGATALVPTIKELSELIKYTTSGKCLTNAEGKMNIYAVIINDQDSKVATEDITTYIDINGMVLDYGNGSREGDNFNGSFSMPKAQYQAGLQQMLALVKAGGSAAIESSFGGFGYVNATGWDAENNKPTGQYIDFPNELLKPLFAMGDMINLYKYESAFGYLGVAFQYFTAA